MLFNIDYPFQVLYPFPMKTWITYIAALLMGLATALLFGDFAGTAGIMSAVSSYLISLGIFIAVPMVVITLASGTASLMKDRMGRKTALSSLLWAVVSAIVMAFAGAAVYASNPLSFPVTSTAGSAPGVLMSHASYMLSSSGSSLYPITPYWTFATATRFILPVIIISWVLGLSLKPSADIIRPAYTVMNSFSEVMFRISRTYTVYGFFLVYVSSASLFTGIYQEKTLFAAPEFAALLAVSVLIMILAVLPLLYAVFTGFRKNPYKVIFRSIGAMSAGFTTSNIVAVLPMNESIARQNLGVQKRIASTSVPLLAVIGHGGSAFISALTLLSLFQATAGETPGAGVIAVAAAAAAAVSFLASAAAGSEVVMITVLVLNLLSINLYGAENAVIALLPVLGGIGTMLDSLITAMGSSIAASFVGTDTDIPYRDTI